MSGSSTPETPGTPVMTTPPQTAQAAGEQTRAQIGAAQNGERRGGGGGGLDLLDLYMVELDLYMVEFEMDIFRFSLLHCAYVALWLLVTLILELESACRC